MCSHITRDRTDDGFTSFQVASDSNRLLRQGVCVCRAQSQNPFDGRAHHCWSWNTPSGSICRIPKYIKIIGEQVATDVDGYINIQRHNASPNFVLSVFQLRCSTPEQYGRAYLEFSLKFWDRGMYGVGKAAKGRGDPEDEIFLLPLRLSPSGKIRGPLSAFIPHDHVKSDDFAMFLFIRQRVVTESQASPPSTGDTWPDLNSWWWPHQPVLAEELQPAEAQQSAPFDPRKELADYAATHSEQQWYIPPRNLEPPAFVGSE